MHSLQLTTPSTEAFVRWLATADDTTLDQCSLPREWFERDTITIARELIGAILVRRSETGALQAARLVETEAYLPHDPASHSWRGKTPRNRAMFERGGCVYVYRIYGIHCCVIVVTEQEGVGAAVLLRAGEPLLGLEEFTIQRGRPIEAARLLSGPANLARCFRFDLDDNGRPCCGDGIWILPAVELPPYVEVSPRIGISRAQDAMLRFFDPTSLAVSARRNAP